MKKILIFIMSIMLAITYKENEVVKAMDYFARSYIVMDLNTKEVLEGKDYHLVRSVASISKIMTAIVAIENSSLDQYVEVKDNVLKAYGSSIYLQIGEVVVMEDLLYGLMLRSGNDAAVTIANGVSGSEEKFVELMNQKAKDIGMKDSLFHNPSGLDVDDEGNLSTSYDMALLMQYAMNNDIFRKITGTNQYKSKNHGVWQNKNKLLRLYDKTSGGKTGFTSKARRTLVTTAKENDTELIVVTLDCGGDFAMHINLYKKYFEKYKTFKLLKKGVNAFEEYNLICDSNISITLKKELIKDTSIIYKIKGETVDVTYINDKENKTVGNCKVSKNTKKHKKKNWFQKIFK